MQKWEYLELAALFYPNEIHYSINGQLVGQNASNPQTIPNLYQYINQLGEDGWELVSCYGESRSRDTSISEVDV